MKKLIILFAFMSCGAFFNACDDPSSEIDQNINLDYVSPAEDEDERSPGPGGGG